jgi:hypothetical protein
MLKVVDEGYEFPFVDELFSLASDRERLHEHREYVGFHLGNSTISSVSQHVSR